VIDASPSGHTSSAVNEDLSVTLRGMAVEDDFTVQHNRQHTTSSVPHPGGPSVSQPRPYSGFADYNPYYTVPAVRESYVDFSYGYGAYRGPTDANIYPSPAIGAAPLGSSYPPVAPQGLHSNVPDIHRTQQGVFFDYGATAHRGSQFYYPMHQPVMYPQPTHSLMIASQLPATLVDKKREMQVRHCTTSSDCALNLVFACQYNVHPHIPSQNIVYGPMRSMSSTLPQTYTAPNLGYGPQIPMAPRPMYASGHNLHHVYPKIRPARRRGINESSIALRSPILDDFRNNKMRKWELRVYYTQSFESC
jgi:hypothetical protein